MENGIGVLIAGVFVGVFIGALAHQLVKKTECGRRTGKQITAALQSVKTAFMEGYLAKVAVPSAEV